MTAEPFQLREESYLSIYLWNEKDSKLKVGFTTKHGGQSIEEFSSLNLGLHVQDQHESVMKNRNFLSRNISFPLEKWIFAEQTHSNNIKKVSKPHSGKGIGSYKDGIMDCDGLYTNDKGIMLSLCFADCVPLYFFHPKSNFIGLAHAGWKGSVQDIAGEMVRKWTIDEGLPYSEILVAIGPSIGACCYKVDDRVITSVNKVLLEKYPLPYENITSGQYNLDLKQLNKNLLMQAGIKVENILVSQQCTSCETDLYFSHRRDDGKTGRMLSFIGIDEEA
ncbi:peptidoglycan editing factor PgeF [Metabacillus litoralis]|uniref:peptidoglycan editing factor PgeF n=1 Tax=Metabacillus litoralis TaxID=152268 RepID=UPI001CFF528C|nr:peptidoglycan editing factor PgeF [Metabacillus litoralis]